ncbi:MAG: hypothetical protein SOY67_05985 [Collinsella sp.]|nr:hypothetical protein [Collinsella sp.]
MTRAGDSGAAALVARVSAWFLGGSWSAVLAWAAAVLALMAVLAWFFILSPYGAPAAPVYAEF